MNTEQFRQRFMLHLPETEQAAAPSSLARQAAVLVPVIDYPQPCLLLTLRANHLRHHPGQVAFPGGKVDATDPTLCHTALRETQEELAIPTEQIEILGRLPVVASRTGFAVTPFVGLLPANVKPRPAPGEVALSFEVPLLPLLQQDHFLPLQIKRHGEIQQIWVCDYQKHFIWGMTAGIIRQLGKQILG